MSRLPQPGGDNGNWGDILNDYLLVEHDTSGHLKDGVVGASQLAANSVTSASIADNTIPQSKIQNLTNDINSKYMKPQTGIPKSDLSSAVQASLNKADTALQSAPPSSGSASGSGFPLRLAGEKLISYPVELGKAHTPTANPSGPKRLLLAESWGVPGILKHVWMASSGGGLVSDFAENGGKIRIYIDNETTPAVELSLNDFFAYAPLGGEFANRRIGRTKRDVMSGESAAYRYLYMPFQKYLRVEVENTTTVDATFFGSADYSIINQFASVGSQQVSYRIIGNEKQNAAPHDLLTVADLNGSGQIESFWIAINAEDGDTGILEGNVEIYVDNEQYPSWHTSGTEDAFNGGWYNVPVGGYPAGRSGNSPDGAMNVTLYRFFVDDPIYFSSHLKIVVHAGQRSQGSISSSSFEIAGFVGVWTDSPSAINYMSVNESATPILDDQLTYPAGNLDGSIWNQVGGATQAQSTGSTIIVSYDGTSAGQDVRIARKNVTLPSDYWVETKVRVTDATHDGQEVSLIAKGATPDPYFGSAVHVQLVRFGINNWVIRVRDDFDEVFVRTIGGGRDLTNVWVKLALKIQGNQVTAYWAHGDSTIWQPVGTWTSGKTGNGFGIGTWTAGAEFDYLVVRPVASVTG